MRIASAILGSALFAAMSAAPALSATYQITDVINDSSGGFRTSVFHTAESNGGMSGRIVDQVRSGTASGSWDSQTGDFQIAFDTVGGRSVEGAGNLLFPGAGDSSLLGSITFTFLDTGVANFLNQAVHTINFLDFDYGVGGGTAPNGFDAAAGIIALWGASGKPSGNNDGTFITPAGLGADFRIAVSEVPLPPAVLMLFSALFMLGWVGRAKILAA